MSYVFSKALTKQDSEERLRKQQSLNIPNKIPPPVSLKPKPVVNGKLPPSIKPKPLRSQSIDVASLNGRNEGNRNSVDLTVVGGSEWKDFVKQRQQRDIKESGFEEEDVKEVENVNGCSRKSSTSSTTSSVFDEATDQATRRTRTCSSSSSTDGIEGTQNRHRSASGNSGKFVRTHSVDLTQVGDDEWKRRASEIQERERIEEDRQQRESIDSGVDVETGASISSDSTDVGTLEDVTSQKELVAVPEDETMGDKTTTQDNPNPPAPPVTLPKPRKLNAELKRTTFSRSGSTKSLSIDAGTGAPIIKKSSDLLKDVKEAPRNSNQRHMSFDASTPYFCKQSRQLSLDLEQTLAQCEQELNETVKVRKASENTESTTLVSPILESANEAEDSPPPPNATPLSPVQLEEKMREIVEMEKSPDVVAMKEEIDVERSMIGTERQKLAITINEIENALFDFDALVSPSAPAAPPTTPVISQPNTETNNVLDSSPTIKEISSEAAMQDITQMNKNEESDNAVSLEVTSEDADQSLAAENPTAVSEESMEEPTVSEPLAAESTAIPKITLVDATDSKPSPDKSVEAVEAPQATAVDTTICEPPSPAESTVEAPDANVVGVEAGSSSANESITAASEETVDVTNSKAESSPADPEEPTDLTNSDNSPSDETPTVASEDNAVEIVPSDSVIAESATEISETLDEGTSVVACAGDEATMSAQEPIADENNNVTNTSESSSIDAHIAENGFSEKVVFV